RQRVVLAQRVEVDRTFDDLADVAVRPTVTLRRKSGKELGVALVAGRGLEEGVQVPARSITRTWRVEVHAESLEDLGRIDLELLPLFRLDLARADLLPVGC